MFRKINGPKLGNCFRIETELALQSRAARGWRPKVYAFAYRIAADLRQVCAMHSY
jgi:hypothetical protein